jgi:hexosaminidase
MLCLALLAGLSVSYVNALWPLPKELSTGSTTVKLSGSFDISLNGVQSAPKDLLDAIERTKDQIANDKLQRLTPDRGGSDAVSAAPELSSLNVVFNGDNVRSISEEAKDALESRNEAYTLSVPADGSAATLSANSSLGLFRGLTTFGQLWYDGNGTAYTVDAPVEISDEPAFVSSFACS